MMKCCYVSAARTVSNVLHSASHAAVYAAVVDSWHWCCNTLCAIGWYCGRADFGLGTTSKSAAEFVVISNRC